MKNLWLYCVKCDNFGALHLKETTEDTATFVCACGKTLTFVKPEVDSRTCPKCLHQTLYAKVDDSVKLKCTRCDHEEEVK